MSVLYCAIPHFIEALARRDCPETSDRPLVLVDPEGRVVDASPQAAACGVVAGLPARLARIRCPEAAVAEADLSRCRQALETLYQVLERTGPHVEPHGWGAAYVDLGDMARNRSDATALCGEIGRAIRRELGERLQPALGWDSTKFTAQAAARRTQPGRLLVLSAPRERAFLQPLPVTLLPLERDALRRLGFLGLRTLGQYAALPAPAVWQQFGRAGTLAQRCARGEDDRPIVPRRRAPCLAAGREFEAPLVQQERLLAVTRRLVAPLLNELRESLRVCGRLRLRVGYQDGSAEERSRAFVFPTAEEPLFLRALEQLFLRLSWPAPTTALDVALEQIEDVAIEQLALFDLEGTSHLQGKLGHVQRYLAARFGANCLRRAALVQPDAPLPEWRVGWIELGAEEST